MSTILTSKDPRRRSTILTSKGLKGSLTYSSDAADNTPYVVLGTPLLFNNNNKGISDP